MKEIFRTDIDIRFHRFGEALCHLMYPKLILITQFKNKNLAPAYAEIGFSIPSVPILAQHDALHAVAEGKVLLAANGMAAGKYIAVIIAYLGNMLHLICLCELVRCVLAVQPRTLQNRAAALQQEDAVDGIRVKCDGNA